MNAEIICVGTELLLGDILNTNAQYLSRGLAECGFNVYSQSVIGDNKERLMVQIKESLGRSDLLILSGGLGPTEDDITKEITADALGLPLEMHKESLKRIEDYFAKMGREMTENNKKQALTIKGAKVLENNNGTAPGYIAQKENKTVILLPGPPNELIPMFEESVIPFLYKQSSDTIYSENVRIFGIGESLVATHCGELLKSENPTASTYAKVGEVDIRVTAKASGEKKAKELTAPVVERIKELFGSNVYTTTEENLQQTVVKLLAAKGKKIATAESCTAGMLSSRITEVPGSSEVFEMGITAYANHIKVEALGVDSEKIQKEGAVSQGVAAQMAVGIRSMSGADIGVGITGVAGPGESEGKPAGLVYIAITDGIKVFVRKILCRGSDREKTRVVATSTALDMVRRYLENAEDLITRGTFVGEPLDLMEGYVLPQKKNEPILSVVPERFKDIQEKLAFSDSEMLRLIALMEDVSMEQLGKQQTQNSAQENGVDDGTGQLNFNFEDDFSFSYEPFEEKNSDKQTEKAPINKAISIFKDNKEKREKPPKKEKPKKEKKEKPVKEKKESKINIKDFFLNFMPLKKDKPAERVRKTVFLAALVLLIISMVYVVGYFYTGIKHENTAQKIAENWHNADKENQQAKTENGYLLPFAELKKANGDLKGWLTIRDTKIDYPVYQTNNNNFYLNHDMNKKRSRYGALYLDAENSVGYTQNSKNVTIYGHSMKDGAMFGELKKYLDYDFYKTHPIFDFSTIFRKGNYKVFAVFITNTLPEHDNGEVFNYRKTDFSSENEFGMWIDSIKARSVIETDIDVEFSDELLTLSTCAYDFEEARLVVMARRVRSDEDYSQSIVASLNPAPLYPEIWYTKKGGNKPLHQIAGSDNSFVSSDDSLENADSPLTEIIDDSSQPSQENTEEVDTSSQTETEKPSSEVETTSDEVIGDR